MAETKLKPEQAEKDKNVSIDHYTGNYNTTSTSWAVVNSTNVKVTLVATGRPVKVTFIFSMGMGSANWGAVDIAVDETDGTGRFGSSGWGLGTCNGNLTHMTTISYVHTPSAGSHTYYLCYKINDAGTLYVGNPSGIIMIAEEL